MADKYVTIRRSITEVFEVNYRWLQASRARQCVTISEKVVQRLMKQENLVVAKPKWRGYGSYLGESSPAPENFNREFQAAALNEKWLTDITEFQIPAGKVYLSPIPSCILIVVPTVAGRVGYRGLATRSWSARGARKITPHAKASSAG